jgi:hypothetical protein
MKYKIADSHTMQKITAATNIIDAKNNEYRVKQKINNSSRRNKSPRNDGEQKTDEVQKTIVHMKIMKIK